MDDPLWAFKTSYYETFNLFVLIPLLVDDPLWVHRALSFCEEYEIVLIPLLVDDPLWDMDLRIHSNYIFYCLNPSFSG